MSSFKSNMNPMFRSKFSEDIFNLKYSHTGCDTWEQLSRVLVEDVCGNLRSGEEALMRKEERKQLQEYITDLKFVPGGRYLYYAGRDKRFYNNCFLLSAEEDTREDYESQIRSTQRDIRQAKILILNLCKGHFPITDKLL